MSFTDDYDRRFGLSFFEVHYWPATGRILVINKEHYEPSPVLTELRVTGQIGSVDLQTATYICALSLADAGNPSGAVIEHDGVMGTVSVNHEASTEYRDVKVRPFAR